MSMMSDEYEDDEDPGYLREEVDDTEAFLASLDLSEHGDGDDDPLPVSPGSATSKATNQSADKSRSSMVRGPPSPQSPFPFLPLLAHGHEVSRLVPRAACSKASDWGLVCLGCRPRGVEVVFACLIVCAAPLVVAFAGTLFTRVRGIMPGDLVAAHSSDCLCCFAAVLRPCVPNTQLRSPRCEKPKSFVSVADVCACRRRASRARARRTPTLEPWTDSLSLPWKQQKIYPSRTRCAAGEHRARACSCVRDARGCSRRSARHRQAFSCSHCSTRSDPLMCGMRTQNGGSNVV